MLTLFLWIFWASAAGDHQRQYTGPAQKLIWCDLAILNLRHCFIFTAQKASDKYRATEEDGGAFSLRCLEGLCISSLHGGYSDFQLQIQLGLAVVHRCHSKAGAQLASAYFCMRKSFHIAAGSALHVGVAWGDQAPEGWTPFRATGVGCQGTLLYSPPYRTCLRNGIWRQLWFMWLFTWLCSQEREKMHFRQEEITTEESSHSKALFFTLYIYLRAACYFP